ncbi:arsenic resistance N-acetyltransferase ArsN2 [bacterium]|nr:arsenic resistance N-acetyltransferase ArsN2 [bacterium]
MRNTPQNPTLEIRQAVEQDYDSISALLKDSALPVKGVSENLQHFIVLTENEQPIGTIGLEMCGSKALLRSMAVSKERQGNGYGSRLCREILDYATEKGLTEVYLLTETAVDFFAARGFVVISREQADEAVQATEEFSRLCPSTATCMRLVLQ